MSKSCVAVARHVRIPNIQEPHRPVPVFVDVIQGLVQGDPSLSDGEVANSILDDVELRYILFVFGGHELTSSVRDASLVISPVAPEGSTQSVGI